MGKTPVSQETLLKLKLLMIKI